MRREQSTIHPPSAGELVPVPDLPEASRQAFPFLDPPTEPDSLGRFGPLTVRRFLGSGAAGLVFLAEDPQLHRPMAIKVLRPELAADPDHRARFLREARAAAALTSDHAVPIYHVGEVGPLPYMAMKNLDGETLHARLARKGRLAVPVALEVAREAALGLADAHALGLVHRDVKPANLWLEADRDRTPGAVRRVRILDFGLARPSAGAVADGRAGGVVGTPQYMSPEQAGGGPLDGRSDLFSLGGVLYTMLVGEPPFRGGSAVATLTAVACVDPPPPAALDPNVPAAVSDLTMRLLAKSRHDRPRSAAAVADEIAGLLDGYPAGSSKLDASVAVGTSHGRAAMTARSSVRAAADPTVPMTLELPPPSNGVRNRRALALLAAGLLAALGVFWLGASIGKTRATGPAPAARPREPIAVGVLHSDSGGMAAAEGPVADATVLAIEEVNTGGGVLGRPLRAVAADGGSDPALFAAQAGRLLDQEHVAAIFGGSTSASRAAMKAVVERKNGLLFYPSAYEGLERSTRIVYTGAIPNQLLLPAVDLVAGHAKANTFHFVAADPVYGRAAFDQLDGRGGEAWRFTGATFRPAGTENWKDALAEVAAANPQVILNAAQGRPGVEFHRRWRAYEFEHKRPRTPILCVGLGENEFRSLGTQDTEGDYFAAGYLEALGTVAATFAEKVRARYGAGRVVSDAMVSAYIGVHLWKRAVEAAGTTDPEAVLAKLGEGATFDGPGGMVLYDPPTHHVKLATHVEWFRPGGPVEVLPGGESRKPVPFPPPRSPEEWERYLDDLREGRRPPAGR